MLVYQATLKSNSNNFDCVKDSTDVCSVYPLSGRNTLHHGIFQLHARKCDSVDITLWVWVWSRYYIVGLESEILEDVQT